LTVRPRGVVDDAVSVSPIDGPPGSNRRRPAPTTILSGDVTESVAALKAQPGRELQVHGSARLGAALLAAGLVATLRLVVAPTIIGAGRRLLPHPSEGVGLRLVRQDATPSGLLLLEYETAGAAPVADYQGVAAHT